MLDDVDDAHSTRSIGIVENPLYAEQEDYTTPSYATLKEREAAVSVMCKSRRGGWSIAGHLIEWCYL